MLLQISTIIEKPINSMETRIRAGIVKNIVVNPQNGQLMALVVRAGFPTKQKILPIQDILSVGPGMVIIRDDSAIVEPDEIVRVNEILKQKIKIMGGSVRTQSGTRLGKVYDVLIDTQTAVIAKYYVRASMTGLTQADRIIPANKVVAITREAIVVRDDFEKVAAVEEVEKVEAEPAGV